MIVNSSVDIFVCRLWRTGSKKAKTKKKRITQKIPILLNLPHFNTQGRIWESLFVCHIEGNVSTGNSVKDVCHIHFESFPQS